MYSYRYEMHERRRAHLALLVSWMRFKDYKPATRIETQRINSIVNKTIMISIATTTEETSSHFVPLKLRKKVVENRSRTHPFWITQFDFMLVKSATEAIHLKSRHWKIIMKEACTHSFYWLSEKLWQIAYIGVMWRLQKEWCSHFRIIKICMEELSLVLRTEAQMDAFPIDTELLL